MIFIFALIKIVALNTGNEAEGCKVYRPWPLYLAAAVCVQCWINEATLFRRDKNLCDQTLYVRVNL